MRPRPVLTPALAGTAVALAGGLLLALTPPDSRAQFPGPPLAPGRPMLPGQQMMPGQQMAPGALPQAPPLMYVRLAGPPGMKVTVYRGIDRGTAHDAPVVLGFRPGYSYRVALSDVPGRPGQVFFPTLEVRGTLRLGNGLRNADFPAAVNFTDEDFGKVQAGTLIKRVVVLERPDAAEPLTTKAEAPIEIPVIGPQDPLILARERGQPVMIVHLGQRFWSPEEMMAAAVPGTVLLPGERFLPPPRVAPWVAWAHCPLFDPVQGPIDPAEFCAIPDGGDVGLKAGFGPTGRLVGVDPSDTVAEYTDSKGRKRLAISNRVCLCVPRFIITRVEQVPAEQVAQLAPGRTESTSGQGTLTARQAPELWRQNQQLEALARKQRASGTVNAYGTAVFGKVQGLEFMSGLRAVESVDGLCVRPVAEAPDLPLLIIKWPDKCGAMIGDAVTFSLKYTNQGGQPITDVVVTDSLTTRFEYIPGSAKADRQAAFTTEPNEAGSLTLRWEFPGTLQPRESGVVTFQVRVR